MSDSEALVIQASSPERPASHWSSSYSQIVVTDMCLNCVQWSIRNELGEEDEDGSIQ